MSRHLGDNILVNKGYRVRVLLRIRPSRRGSGGVLVGLYLSVKTLKNEKKRREKREKKKKEKGRILVLKFRTFRMLGPNFSVEDQSRDHTGCKNKSKKAYVAKPTVGT